MMLAQCWPTEQSQKESGTHKWTLTYDHRGTRKGKPILPIRGSRTMDTHMEKHDMIPTLLHTQKSIPDRLQI